MVERKVDGRGSVISCEETCQYQTHVWKWALTSFHRLLFLERLLPTFRDNFTAINNRHSFMQGVPDEADMGILVLKSSYGLLGL